MSYIAEETYDVYSERIVRARKAHRCSACREEISCGQRYWRVTAIYDGDVMSLRRCERCQYLHEHLRARCRTLVGENIWPAEHLNCGEKYEDEWGEEPPDEIAALAFWRPGDPMPEAS